LKASSGPNSGGPLLDGSIEVYGHLAIVDLDTSAPRAK